MIESESHVVIAAELARHEDIYMFPLSQPKGLKCRRLVRASERQRALFITSNYSRTTAANTTVGAELMTNRDVNRP